MTIAAQLATAPVTAGTFGVLSLIGPFANALALPLLPLVIVTGGAGALVSTVAPALGWLPLEVAAIVCRVLLAIAQGASSMPFAAIQLQLWPGQWTLVELAGAVAGALAWLAHRRLRPPTALAGAVALTAALVAGIATAMIASAASGRALRLTVLDVGNGVAVLVRPPGGGAMLVDGGSDGTALLSALGRVCPRSTVTSMRWCSPPPTGSARLRSAACSATTMSDPSWSRSLCPRHCRRSPRRSQAPALM